MLLELTVGDAYGAGFEYVDRDTNHPLDGGADSRSYLPALDAKPLALVAS